MSGGNLELVLIKIQLFQLIFLKKLIFLVTMFLTEDGLLYSVGYNYYGELGLGNNILSYNSPQLVESLKDVEFIECGSSFTFCKTLNGTYCWGFNLTGQLGLENRDNQNTPILCSSLLNEDVLSCGKNEYGQLGRETDDEYCSYFKKIEVLPTIRRVECGYSNSFCIDIDNDLFVFGVNDNGQLGLGDTNNRNKPTKHPSLSNIIDISTGGCHTFIMNSVNEIYAFGDNDRSQLGIKTEYNDQLTPIRVFEDNEDIWFSN